MLDPLSFNLPQSVPTPLLPPLPTRRLLQPSPDHPDDYILELDYSHGLGSFCVCPTLWRNINVFSREGNRPNNATQFGTLFHTCEEVRLQNGYSDAVRQRQHEIIFDHFLHHPAPPDEYRTGDRMIQVLAKYNAKYSLDDALEKDNWDKAIVVHEGEKMLERPFKVPLCTVSVNGELPYSVEQVVVGKPCIIGSVAGETFPVDGPNGGLPVRNLHILLTGRIDAIISNSNQLFVVDHKTTSRDEREVTEAFHLSLQTRGYAWAAQQLGFPVAGCIINSILIRPPAKTDRAQKPREGFERHTYFYDADRIADFVESAKLHVSTLVHYLVQGAFPQVSLSFKSPCPNCDFADNCRLPRHQRSADLASDIYRDVTWSPINE